MSDDVKQEPSGYLASGSLEEISLDVVVFHADGTSTDYGMVSRTNFKEQAEAEALAHPKQNGILKRISSMVRGENSNG